LGEGKGGGREQTRKNRLEISAKVIVRLKTRGQKQRWLCAPWIARGARREGAKRVGSGEADRGNKRRVGIDVTRDRNVLEQNPERKKEFTELAPRKRERCSWQEQKGKGIQRLTGASLRWIMGGRRRKKSKQGKTSVAAHLTRGGKKK